MTAVIRSMLIAGAIATVATMLTWFQPAHGGVVHVVRPITLDLYLLDPAAPAPRRDLRGNPIEDALRQYRLSPDGLLPNHRDAPEERLGSPSA